ncbi:MAG TPA: pyridoxal-5-phosphate-dependent protein subunit beta, partial [Anaerolineales bacterium]|nr:pyridoxal-5-phosphate-dependent protein subunit beta [Anaerolineales bacterium]
MTTIDLTVQKDRRARAIQRAREKNIIIPTYAQMKDPSKIPDKLQDELKDIGLWDIHPRNLFRINWHNQPAASGGTFGGVNYLE